MSPASLRCLVVSVTVGIVFGLGCTSSSGGGAAAPDGGGATDGGLLADGGGAGPDGGGLGPDGGGLPDDQGSTVTGTVVDLYATDQGDVNVPLGPDKVEIAALVPVAGGGFMTIPAVVLPDGTFTIAGVPAGPYYVSYLSKKDASQEFVVTSERILDLGHVNLGRPTVGSATMPTSLTINATGLSPWHTDDRIQIFSSGAGALEAFADVFATGQQLMAGDTSLQNFAVDVSLFESPRLVDAAKGDTVTVTHFGAATTGTFAYQAITQVYAPAPFSQIDGQAVTVTGAFAAVPQRHATLRWNQPAFAARAAEVNPAAKLTSFELTVYAEPGGTRSTFPNPNVITAYVDATTMTPQDQTLDLAFGNPFPAAWPLYACLTTGFSVAWLETWTFTNSVCGTLDTIAAAPGVPVVASPRDLQVNGKPATGDTAGMGVTPTFTWKAPALGTAAGYGLAIFRRDAVGDWQGVTNIATQGTSVTVPPGLLQAGSQYFALLSANTRFDPKHSARYDNATSFAQAVSGLLSP
jgi:hypothetical protein